MVASYPLSWAVSQGTSFVASPTAHDEHAGRHRVERAGVPDLARRRARGARAATTSWLVGPRGLSTTRTPSSDGAPTGGQPNQTERRSRDGAIEHRLDRAAHPLGQPRRRGSRRRPTRRRSPSTIDGLAEEDLPLRRRRQQAERARGAGRSASRGGTGCPSALVRYSTRASIGLVSSPPTMATGTMGVRVRRQSFTKPPRPKRWSL